MAPNLRVYEGRFYEDAYLAGIVAGEMTKTNVIGFVGSFPIPEVLRNINAFTLGALSVNPKVKTKVVWVGSWFDPPKEAEAAQSLINQKADVLLQNTDSTAVLQTAEKNGKYAFGWDSDMSAFAPKAHLGSARLNWGLYYDKAIGDVLNKTWKTEATKWGVKEGLPEFVALATFIPDSTKKKVEDAKAGMKAGTVAAFQGPLLDNTGKEVLAKGVVGERQVERRGELLREGRRGQGSVGEVTSTATAVLDGGLAAPVRISPPEEDREKGRLPYYHPSTR